MNTNGSSPRIGLLLVGRIIRAEVVAQARIRDRARQKNHVEQEEEAEYALSILERVAERVSIEAKKHGRTPHK